MRLLARKSLIACDCGDHWMTDQPQPGRFGKILGLPGVEQIVDDREEALLGRIPRLREVVIEVRLVDGLDGRVDVRVGRQHHAPRQRVDLARSREHLGALDARHPLVADHQRERVAPGLQLPDRRERLFTRGGAHDHVGLAVSRAEIPPHRGQHLRIVVHDEKHGLVHGVSSRPLGRRRSAGRRGTPSARAATRRRSRRRCG